MKKIITLILLLFFCLLNSFGQIKKEQNIIKLDSTWGKELFPFPIRFAKNINYTGVAEVLGKPREGTHQYHWQTSSEA